MRTNLCVASPRLCGLEHRSRHRPECAVVDEEELVAKEKIGSLQLSELCRLEVGGGGVECGVVAVCGGGVW